MCRNALVLFGDMGGNFDAVDASNGQRLWNTHLDGAIGGGVVTYSAGGSQMVAVARSNSVSPIKDESSLCSVMNCQRLGARGPRVRPQRSQR